jgi:Protein of unknown function (DUF3175)
MSKAPKKSSKARRWSGKVTKRSDALDLESDVFKGKDPHRIASSLKTFCRAQQTTQRHGISIGNVDVEFLRQPRWQKSA